MSSPQETTDQLVVFVLVVCLVNGVNASELMSQSHRLIFGQIMMKVTETSPLKQILLILKEGA